MNELETAAVSHANCRGKVTLCVSISPLARQRAKQMAIQLNIPLKQLVEEVLLAAEFSKSSKGTDSDQPD